MTSDVANLPEDTPI